LLKPVIFQFIFSQEWSLVWFWNRVCIICVFQVFKTSRQNFKAVRPELPYLFAQCRLADRRQTETAVGGAPSSYQSRTHSQTQTQTETKTQTQTQIQIQKQKQTQNQTAAETETPLPALSGIRTRIRICTGITHMRYTHTPICTHGQPDVAAIFVIFFNLSLG